MSTRSVKIILDKPSSHCYVPGEAIIGRVVYESNKDDEIPDITIRFQGKSKTRIKRDKTHYTHEFLLFRKFNVLFKGPFTLPASKHEWPFEFVFPEHTIAECKDFRLRNQFDLYDSEIQALPPNYEGSSLHHQASVRYKLSVRIQRSITSVSDEHILNFSPFRHELQPDLASRTIDPKTNHFVVKFKVDENGLPRALSGKESIKSFFLGASAKRGVMSFTTRLQIHVPTVLIQGMPLPFSLGIFPQLTEMSAAELPSMTIARIIVRLKSRTNIRTPGNFSEHEEDFGDSHPLGDFSEITARPFVGGMQSIPLPLRWLPFGVPPSFATCNINRVYELSVHVDVACLGLSHTVKFSVRGVKLLSGRARQDTREAQQAILESIRTENDATGAQVGADELPAYEPKKSKGGEDLPGYVQEGAASGSGARST